MPRKAFAVIILTIIVCAQPVWAQSGTETLLCYAVGFPNPDHYEVDFDHHTVTAPVALCGGYTEPAQITNRAIIWSHSYCGARPTRFYVDRYTGSMNVVDAPGPTPTQCRHAEKQF